MAKAAERPSLFLRIPASMGARIWTVPTIEKGIKFTRHVQSLGNGEGGTILNILGEHHNNILDIHRDIESYTQLVERKMA